MTLGESRERSGQQENDPRGRETVEAGDSALEDVSEEEVGWPLVFVFGKIVVQVCNLAKLGAQEVVVFRN
jgi:hypothetical protein